MRAFVTGATGTIGSHLCRSLLRDGHDVVALVRSLDGATALREAGVTLVGGDVTEPATLTAMKRSDAVFHLAAWYAIGVTDRQRMYAVNVAGTENVLNAAADAGVGRVVHCSSVAALGAGEPGAVRDETATHSGTFASVYEETKWHAHRAAGELAEQGVPVVIAMPAAVYGPGDRSVLSLLWRYYARGWLVAMPGLDGAFSWVHVDDVADGLIALAERGTLGEEYILGGDNASVRELFARAEPLTGIRAPRFALPDRLASLARPFGGPISRALGQQPRFLEEGLASLRGSWMFTSDKAAGAVGYRFRSLEDGVPPVVNWYRAH